jgi:hypothetical protein
VATCASRAWKHGEEPQLGVGPSAMIFAFSGTEKIFANILKEFSVALSMWYLVEDTVVDG